jgi:hypothetical protein
VRKKCVSSMCLLWMEKREKSSHKNTHTHTCMMFRDFSTNSIHLFFTILHIRIMCVYYAYYSQQLPISSLFLENIFSLVVFFFHPRCEAKGKCWTKKHTIFRSRFQSFSKSRTAEILTVLHFNPVISITNKNITKKIYMNQKIYFGWNNFFIHKKIITKTKIIFYLNLFSING